MLWGLISKEKIIYAVIILIVLIGIITYAKGWLQK